MRKSIAALFVLCFVLALAVPASAHCEMPCGIYDDEARIKEMAEEIATIEKSMNEIVRLQAESPVNYNQLVRWVNNKEEHARALQEIVWQYFMTQRIKPVTSTDTLEHDKYAKKLEMLHLMLYYAMKCKQTTDLSNVNNLRELLKDFDREYFERDMQEQEQKPTNIFDELEKRLGK